MYAIVKDAAITATGTIKQLFPNTSFAGGVANEEFKKAENVEDVINSEQKDRTYYFVTQGNIVLVDGVPTQQFTNTAKLLNDRDATDKDGNKVTLVQSNIDAARTTLNTEAAAVKYKTDRTYPSIGDQLDMQYWDKKNGTTTWVDAVAKVKSDNPKP